MSSVFPSQCGGRSPTNNNRFSGWANYGWNGGTPCSGFGHDRDENGSGRINYSSPNIADRLARFPDISQSTFDGTRLLTFQSSLLWCRRNYGEIVCRLTLGTSAGSRLHFYFNETTLFEGKPIRTKFDEPFEQKFVPGQEFSITVKCGDLPTPDWVALVSNNASTPAFWRNQPTHPAAYVHIYSLSLMPKDQNTPFDIVQPRRRCLVKVYHTDDIFSMAVNLRTDQKCAVMRSSFRCGNVFRKIASLCKDDSVLSVDHNCLSDYLGFTLEGFVVPTPKWIKSVFPNAGFPNKFLVYANVFELRIGYGKIMRWEREGNESHIEPFDERFSDTYGSLLFKPCNIPNRVPGLHVRLLCCRSIPYTEEPYIVVPTFRILSTSTHRVSKEEAFSSILRTTPYPEQPLHDGFEQYCDWMSNVRETEAALGPTVSGVRAGLTQSHCGFSPSNGTDLSSMKNSTHFSQLDDMKILEEVFGCVTKENPNGQVAGAFKPNSMIAVDEDPRKRMLRNVTDLTLLQDRLAAPVQTDLAYFSYQHFRQKMIEAGLLANEDCLIDEPLLRLTRAFTEALAHEASRIRRLHAKVDWSELIFETFKKWPNKAIGWRKAREIVAHVVDTRLQEAREYLRKREERRLRVETEKTAREIAHARGGADPKLEAIFEHKMKIIRERIRTAEVEESGFWPRYWKRKRAVEEEVTVADAELSDDEEIETEEELDNIGEDERNVDSVGVLEDQEHIMPTPSETLLRAETATVFVNDLIDLGPIGNTTTESGTGEIANGTFDKIGIDEDLASIFF